MRIDHMGKRPRGRLVDLYADGAVALTLSPDTVQEAGLRLGDELTSVDIARLRFEDDRKRAMRTALRLVARRPHSESELRDRLRRDGFGKALVDTTVTRVRELGYVDDRAFAEYWTERRQTATPRSRRMLRWELATKGVGAEVVSHVTEPLDDDEAAYRVAARRARSLTNADEARFRQKLANSLQQRGFGWDAIRRAVDRCWAERAPSEN